VIVSSWIVDSSTGAVREDRNGYQRRRRGIVPQHRQIGTGDKSARRFLGVYARPADADLIDAEAAARGMSRSAFLIMAALAHVHPGRARLEAAARELPSAMADEPPPPVDPAPPAAVKD
jgi:hypothetical protein